MDVVGITPITQHTPRLEESADLSPVARLVQDGVEEFTQIHLCSIDLHRCFCMYVHRYFH